MHVKLWLALFAVLPLVAVSSGSSANAGAASPPRNGLIAVVGENGLRIVDPQPGTAVLLPGGEKMSDPAWSPDGELLAVTRLNEESAAIYTVKPDGSNLELVYQGALDPSWSPDGKWLAVVPSAYLDETATLVLVKADGTEKREIRVKGASTYIGRPQWSPDGKRIALVDDAGHIRLVTPDGETLAVYRDREAGNLSWSPDSSLLAFDAFDESGKTMRQIIVVLDLATGKETVLQGRYEGAGSPAWSPDGKQLAFISLSAQTSAAMTGGCGGEHYASHLWTIAPDGTRAHRLVKGSYNGNPSWARSVEPGPAD